jgi:hypothetical protein
MSAHPSTRSTRRDPLVVLAACVALVVGLVVTPTAPADARPEPTGHIVAGGARLAAPPAPARRWQPPTARRPPTPPSTSGRA